MLWARHGRVLLSCKLAVAAGRSHAGHVSAASTCKVRGGRGAQAGVKVCGNLWLQGDGAGGTPYNMCLGTCVHALRAVAAWQLQHSSQSAWGICIDTAAVRGVSNDVNMNKCESVPFSCWLPRIEYSPAFLLCLTFHSLLQQLVWFTTCSELTAATSFIHPVHSLSQYSQRPGAYHATESRQEGRKKVTSFGPDNGASGVRFSLLVTRSKVHFNRMPSTC